MPTNPDHRARLTAFAADWEANVYRPYPAPGDLIRVHPDLAWMNGRRGAPADLLYVTLEVHPNAPEKRGARRDLRVAFVDGDGDVQTMLQDHRIMYPIDHPVFARAGAALATESEDTHFADLLSLRALAGWVSVTTVRGFFASDADMLAAMCAAGWQRDPVDPDRFIKS